MSKVAVIGAGSWGTALSIVLADNGCQVALYSRRDEQVYEINELRTNTKYLPHVKLPDGIMASSSLAKVLDNAQYVLIVLPTAAIRETLREMNNYIQARPLFIHSAKGLEPDTHKRISEMIAEEVPSEKRRGILVLSGPSHAEEVSRRAPTTVAVAGENLKQAEEVQNLFFNRYFRVYTNSDVLGVELGGALKNIIALGAGLSDGLGFGDNAKAALMTRGLAEITRLGVDLGAHPLTFSGLTGLGDLIVTCTSRHSRNWRCGYALGKGEPLHQVLSNMGMVVEGVDTTKAAFQIAQTRNVEMPITQELYQVLFKGKSPFKAVNDLMQRDRRHEWEINLFH
jgi:glycerol-3-phosphate dehydrogenase (NAD(P)+)